MALRTRYGYNCQRANWGLMFEVVPTGYLEVVPGETVFGNVSVNVFSAPTFRNVRSRSYMDVYAFYVPFRLLWSGFPDFISGADDGATIPPTVADAFPFNFENRLVQGPAGAPGVSNNAWFRRAYNLIAEKFFLAVDNTDGDPDDTATQHVAKLRPSTFEASTAPKAIPVESVDTSGPTLSIDEIRDAAARDQFGKMRAYYGDRYVDYLAAVGVQANWSILDEPELIGQLHTDWVYRMVNNTASDPGATVDSLGFTAGYYNSAGSLKVKRTFVPEHGLIALYTVCRADPLTVNPYVDPVLGKPSRDDYWSPEFETNKLKRWTSALRAPGNITFVAQDERPYFEEYRKGLNTNAERFGVGDQGKVMGLTNLENVWNPNPAAFNDDFDTSVMVDDSHFQVTADLRLRRMSPVMKHGQQRPIY